MVARSCSDSACPAECSGWKSRARHTSPPTAAHRTPGRSTFGRRVRRGHAEATASLKLVYPFQRGAVRHDPIEFYHGAGRSCPGGD